MERKELIKELEKINNDMSFGEIDIREFAVLILKELDNCSVDALKHYLGLLKIRADACNIALVKMSFDTHSLIKKAIKLIQDEIIKRLVLN